jgi:hypothetical protein
MYAVAASNERTVWVPPAPGRPQSGPQPEPCGVRHAVANLFSVPVAGQDLCEPTALCGARLRGWRIYPGCLFDPSHAAACQRCAQLVCLKMEERLGPVHRRPVVPPRRLI